MYMYITYICTISTHADYEIHGMQFVVCSWTTLGWPRKIQDQSDNMH